jgi:hypothetical protein
MEEYHVPLMFPVRDDEHDDDACRKDDNLFEIDPDDGFDGEEEL